MKRNYIALFLFLLTAYPAYSQSTTSKPLISQSKLSFGLEGLGFTFEPVLLPLLTVDISGGIGGSYSISEDNFDYSINPMKPSFFVALNPRLFYNQRKRTTENKNISLNSGNYFGIKMKFATKSISSDISSDRVLLYNAHWGMQREVGKNLLWDISGGIGYGDNTSTMFGTVYPAIDLKFSYVL